MSETYQIDLVCGNCGENFTETLPKGHVVKYANNRRENTISIPEGSFTIQQIQTIECPKCGSSKKVRKSIKNG